MTAEPHAEYMRRNLQVCRAIGARAILQGALNHAETLSHRRPGWMRTALTSALERVDTLSADLARWRDMAMDAPADVRPLEMDQRAADDLDALFGRVFATDAGKRLVPHLNAETQAQVVAAVDRCRRAWSTGAATVAA